MNSDLEQGNVKAAQHINAVKQLSERRCQSIVTGFKRGGQDG